MPERVADDHALVKRLATVLYERTFPKLSLRTPDRREEDVRIVLDALRAEGVRLLKPVDPTDCYECGKHVEPLTGHQQGRAGWVHNACLEG